MRHTKIVATIGPASDSTERLQQMVNAGINVARLNFSHGTHQEHAARIAAIREVAKKCGKHIGIMLDTKGPEVRVGQLPEGEVQLEAGQEVILSVVADKGIPVTYPGLPNDVKQGDSILLDDGLIDLEVIATGKDTVTCKVQNDGLLRSGKGVNVPGVLLELPPITAKDIKDISFAVEHDLDFIAASFVRRGADILEIRRILESKGGDAHIIAKIETQAAVNNIDEILQVSDGVMVARGDLGVEIPSEEVPLVQKEIIRKCNNVGKPVITATQMLDSMISHPRPTRAEASDVANAILDGTDAIMLSGETAAGDYPVESVTTMDRIAQRAEQAIKYKQNLQEKQVAINKSVTDAISHASCNIAFDLNTAAIITPTESGSTPRKVAKYRPRAPIIATTFHSSVLRKLSLVWGVSGIEVPATEDTDAMINTAVNAAVEHQLIYAGDIVVITAGLPVGVSGTTNLLKVHIVGEIITQGTGIGDKAVTGRVKIVHSGQEAAEINEGDIMVAVGTYADNVPAMKKAAAVVTEEAGITSHAAIVGLSLGIPVVVGVSGATTLLEEGMVITVDSDRGIIYKGATRIL